MVDDLSAEVTKERRPKSRAAGRSQPPSPPVSEVNRPSRTGGGFDLSCRGREP
jgi:hypothetical protein